MDAKKVEMSGSPAGAPCHPVLSPPLPNQTLPGVAREHAYRSYETTPTGHMRPRSQICPVITPQKLLCSAQIKPGFCSDLIYYISGGVTTGKFKLFK